MAYTNEVKDAAKRLYLRGAKPSEIKQRLNLATDRIVYYWAAKGCWAEMIAYDTPLDALERRIAFMFEVDSELTGKQLNELERLTVIRGKLLNQVRTKAAASNNNDNDNSTNQKPKKRRVKNDISHISKEMLDDWFDNNLFEYQKDVRREKNNPLINRLRNYLKSRQIGFTWYFAHEAFEDAVLSGDNQIFISASKSQAELFKTAIILFGQDFDVELSGAPMILSNGATLYFLSTNSSTAQGPSGHLYTDEYFWIQKFKRLQTVTSGMASHKKWRKTYFSTPSTVDHEAYAFWNGDNYKNSKRKNKKPWPTDEEIKKGVLCPDGQYRKIVTIEDALAGGCDLFNIEELRDEYDTDSFNMLYRCQFINDALGVFKLIDLEQCLGDVLDWDDFKQEAARPFGNSPVWIGYDPSRTRDNASIVIIAPPIQEGGQFRLLKRYSWNDKTYLWQAEQLKKICGTYNVQHIGIDITGTGYGVFDSVKKFYPRVRPIHYSLEEKTRLVLKAQEVIKSHRITWDAGDTEIGAAFLTVKRTTTQNGNITYSASRTDKTGHADVAWAIMHALIAESLALSNHSHKSIMRVY